MPSKNTIRNVYNWASHIAPPFFVARDAVGVLPLSYRTIQLSLDALEDMGLAEEGPKGWAVTGNAADLDQALAGLVSDELEKVTDLLPIERVRDVFEYASRCASTGS